MTGDDHVLFIDRDQLVVTVAIGCFTFSTAARLSRGFRQ